MSITIYTDGACRVNPGIGGWGALVCTDKDKKRLYGSELDTTNNRMELLAVIRPLQALKKHSVVEVITDSRYVCDGVTSWMKSWKTANWIKGDGKPIKNQDLWEQLDAEVNRHTVTCRWVKGHNGHKENEIADKLANYAIDQLIDKVRDILVE